MEIRWSEEDNKRWRGREKSHQNKKNICNGKMFFTCEWVRPVGLFCLLLSSHIINISHGVFSLYFAFSFIRQIIGLCSCSLVHVNGTEATPTKQTNMIYSILCCVTQLLISFACMCLAKLSDCLIPPSSLSFPCPYRAWSFNIVSGNLFVSRKTRTNRTGRMSVRAAETEVIARCQCDISSTDTKPTAKNIPTNNEHEWNT